MRIGQNPAKSIEHVAQPEKITVAIVTYIPFTGGYYAESLQVLKACLDSIRENTDLPYDLLVFDNASCPEVCSYLREAQEAGWIQYLVLSEKNIGKAGAWNFIFGAAPGEFIAYADSDIYFYPGWLSAQIQVLEAIPQAGMVTGIPLWSPEEFSTSTVRWAEETPGVRLERGRFLPWEDYWRHSRSLGKDEDSARAHYETIENIRLHYQGRQYYAGAGHFQFVARRRVLHEVLPIPSNRPMGQVRMLDIVLNQRGYLRLSTPRWWVQHMGNTLASLETAQGGSFTRPATDKAAGKNNPLLELKAVRRFLLWVYNKSFEILYRS